MAYVSAQWGTVSTYTWSLASFLPGNGSASRGSTQMVSQHSKPEAGLRSDRESLCILPEPTAGRRRSDAPTQGETHTDAAESTGHLPWVDGQVSPWRVRSGCRYRVHLRVERMDAWCRPEPESRGWTRVLRALLLGLWVHCHFWGRQCLCLQSAQDRACHLKEHAHSCKRWALHRIA